MIEFFSWPFFVLACLLIGACFFLPRSKRYIGIAISNLILGTLLLGASYGLLVALSLLGFFAHKRFSQAGGRIVFHVTWLLSLLPLLLLRSAFDFHLKGMILSFSLCFFCLQHIGALIDIYKKRAEAPADIMHWLAYTLFFPSLIAGPIARWSEMRPALLNPTIFTKVRGIEGVLLCAQGLFKKMVFAAPLILISSRFFAEPKSFGPTAAVFVAFVFRYGIWADISSHTDWARGFASLLGIPLRPNFNRPFQTTSLVEFWRRWHISLSSWLLDYVFYPIALGPLRRLVPGALALVIAVLSTFVLLGFWHQVSFTLMIMGLINGMGVLLAGFLESRWEAKNRCVDFLRHSLGLVIMFVFLLLPTLLISLSIHDALTLVLTFSEKIEMSSFRLIDAQWPASLARLISTTDGPMLSSIPIFSIAIAALCWELIQFFSHKMGTQSAEGAFAAPAFAEGSKLSPAWRLIFVFVLFVVWLVFADFESTMGFVYVKI